MTHYQTTNFMDCGMCDSAAMDHSSNSAAFLSRASMSDVETVNAADGDKHILANRYKTKMCKNFITTGSCPYEMRCMFAHGEYELRTSKDNLRDGLTSEEAIRRFQHQQQYMKRRSMRGAASRVAPHHAVPEDFYAAQDYIYSPMDDFYIADAYCPPAVYTHQPYTASVLASEDRLYSNELAYGGFEDSLTSPADYFPAAEVEQSTPSSVREESGEAAVTTPTMKACCVPAGGSEDGSSAHHAMILEP